MTNLAAQIETLSNENDHTGAAIAMCAHLAGALGVAYRVVLDEIADRTELAGSIDRDDQTLRDAIARDLRKTLILQGKI